jgi:hypothetical protein
MTNSLNMQSRCRGEFRSPFEPTGACWQADHMVAAYLGYRPEAPQKPQDSAGRTMPHPVMGFKTRPIYGL